MAKKNNHPELDKWQKEIERLSYFEENTVNKKLFKYYRQALIEIKKELKVFIDNYENLSFSKKLEAERLLLNGKQIDKILRDMNKEVNNTIEKYVHDSAELGYYGAWYAIEGAHNIQLDMNMLPEKYIKQLVHHPVKGKVFSKRLYKHRDRLAKETTNALLDTARKGKSYAVAAKQINELTEASYKRALRIARTEGGRVQSTAKQRSYVEAKKKGVDLKKKWLSTLDSKTRDTHQGLDGQVVEIEDKFVSPNGHKADGPRLFGVASEDIHCRCTTITEVNGISPELRKDNLRNEEFPYQNYEEWKKDKLSESALVRNDSSMDKKFKVYPVKKSNVDWNTHFDIDKKGSDLLNDTHSKLNEFMNTNKREKLFLLDKGTNSISYELEGKTIDQVVFTKDLVQTLKNGNPNDFILSHVHPSKTPFSREDIRKLIDFKSIGELTLESADGSKYLMSRGTFKSNSLKKLSFDNNYGKIYNSIAKKYPDLEDESKIYNVWDDFMFDVNKGIADFYGMKFKKVE